MTAPLPAGWDPSTDLLGSQWTAIDPAVQAQALQWAVRVLWALSGRQFSVADITVAPYLPLQRPLATLSVAQPLSAGPGRVPYLPGRWGPAVAARLPGPVVDVSSVVVDGEVLPTEAWTVDPDGMLVRLDEGTWPTGQDVYRPRWTVRYRRGRIAPPDANIAAGQYAMELAQAISAPALSKLPAGVRDLARQGVSTSMADPTVLANAGLTGVPQVDAWLRSVNPTMAHDAPAVWTPELSRHRIIEVHKP